LDLDLGVLRVLRSFFLSFSSIAFVALVGFEREGLGHSVCPCLCIWCIGFEFSTVIRGGEVEKLITLGCLGTLELVPLGCLGALDGCGAWSSIIVVYSSKHFVLGTSEPQALVVKLHGVVGSLQLSCGDSPNLVCTGSVTTLKGPLVESRHLALCEGVRRLRWP
jgi:hypothetical protein